MQKKSLTWTQKLSDQLNLANVARKKIWKKNKLKQNKRQCALNSVEVHDPWRQFGRNKNDYGGKDLRKRWVWSLEWKTEGVVYGENKGDVIRWYAQNEVNQEESEQNEVDGTKKGADSTGKVMHIWKSGWWFVMSDEDTDYYKLQNTTWKCLQQIEI